MSNSLNQSKINEITEDFKLCDDGRYKFYEEYKDDKLSTIDSLKNIKIDYSQIPITQESNSEIIPFIMNRYYDGVDLLGMLLQIHYVNSEGYEDYSIPINVYYSKDKIKFSWLTNTNVTAIEGDVTFEIIATGVNSHNENYVWKTKPNGKINVLKSLSGNGIIETTPEWYNSFSIKLQDCFDVISTTKEDMTLMDNNFQQFLSEKADKNHIHTITDFVGKLPLEKLTGGNSNDILSIDEETNDVIWKKSPFKSLNGKSINTSNDNIIEAKNGSLILNDLNPRTYDENNSVLSGNIATGENSLAIGSKNSALGNCSFAEGCNNIVGCNYSHVEGLNNIINSQSYIVHSEGYNNEVLSSITTSHIEGDNNKIRASYSHIEGSSNEVYGAYSHFEGYSNSVDSAYASHIEGYSNKINGNIAYSHIEGYSNKINGSIAYSHIEGFSNEVDASYSHIEGGRNKITNSSFIHIEGCDNKTNNAEGSHIDGAFNTIENATKCHVNGCNNIIGDSENQSIACFASGQGNKSYGRSSAVMGEANISYDCQLVIGAYNKKIRGNYLLKPPSETSLFIIGNGYYDSSNRTENRSNAFRVNADGQCYSLGAYNTSGADYAEMFEWEDGNVNNEDRRGLFVTLENDKIRIANSKDEYILGVVSSCPSIIGDSASEDWNNKYKKDVFGNIITKKVKSNQIKDGDKIILDETLVKIPIINDDYNLDIEYIPRNQRNEWAPVGLLGKIIVIDDGTCEVNGYCKCNDDGIATKSDYGYKVMSRIDENHIKIMYR